MTAWRATFPTWPPGRDREIAARIRQVDERNARFFDEEVLKLDQWSDDLKSGLEREIQEVDREIREARKTAALAGTMAENLDVQRTIKDPEARRSRKRRDPFDDRDDIDRQRDGLIGWIEAQLKQRQTVTTQFTRRWMLV